MARPASAVRSGGWYARITHSLTRDAFMSGEPDQLSRQELQTSNGRGRREASSSCAFVGLFWSRAALEATPISTLKAIAHIKAAGF
jgi:hypothetical protein